MELKQCSFCKAHKEGDIIHTQLHQTRSLQDGLIISGTNWYIRYCPICGAKLNDGTGRRANDG